MSLLTLIQQELPWPTGEPSYTGKVWPSPGAWPAPGTGHCSGGWMQKRLCPGATLLRMVKAWVRTKNEFGEGKRTENTDMNIPGKHKAEGPDAGGHKPQPAAASTASHGHGQHSQNTRPIPSWVGSFPPVTVLSQGAETEAVASGCCHGMVRQLSTPDSLLLQGLLQTGSCLSQLRRREKPDFPLSPGSTWAEGSSLWSLFLGQRVT